MFVPMCLDCSQPRPKTLPFTMNSSQWKDVYLVQVLRKGEWRLSPKWDITTTNQASGNMTKEKAKRIQEMEDEEQCCENVFPNMTMLL